MTFQELVENALRAEIRKQLEEAKASDEEISSIIQGFDESATFYLDIRVGDDELQSIEDTIADYLVAERDAYQMMQERD